MEKAGIWFSWNFGMVTEGNFGNEKRVVRRKGFPKPVTVFFLENEGIGIKKFWWNLKFAKIEFTHFKIKNVIL